MADVDRNKKAVSDRRKQQNKQAQKNYRDRQTRRLRTLEAILQSREVHPGEPVATWAAPSNPCTSLAPPQLALDRRQLQHSDQNLPALAFSDAWQSSIDARCPASKTNSQPLSYSNSSSVLGSSSSGKSTQSTANLELSSSHRILYRLLQEDGRIEDTTRRSIVSGELPIEDILKAGLYALSKNVVSQRPTSPRAASPIRAPLLRTDKIFVIENKMQEHSHSLPDLHVNCIRIKQLCGVAGVRYNAEMLGFTFEQLCDETTDSPFHDASVAGSMDHPACPTKFQHISPDLRPIAAQLLFRHSMWIDTIPSPTLRQRLIRGLASDPPTIDEDDFCLDMQKDGLICWGSTSGQGEQSAGSGAPWDVRSWEVQPWFLKKWWFVLGGSTGELFQTSKWWNEMRGDCLRVTGQ